MKFITTYAVKTATKDNSKKSPSEEHTTHVRARRSSYPKSGHDQQRTFVAWQVTRHKYAQTKHFLKLRKFDVQAIKCLSHSNASVNSSCAQPPPPPPGQGYCRAFANFCSARGPGICQPQSYSQAFNMHAVSYQSITTQRILLEKQAYWLNCQGQV